MAAPSIPNLLSGRLNSRQPGLRSIHDPSSDAPHPRRGVSSRSDAIIQRTNTDASISRLSAVNAGYLDDPYATFFVQRVPGTDASRRMPLINRGTYIRTIAIDRLVETFFQRGGQQVVSLGAGSDTRFWRLVANHTERKDVVWHEIDFEENTTEKVAIIKSNPRLKNAFAAEEQFSSSIHSTQYHLHPLDLRTLVNKTKSDAASAALATLKKYIDPKKPTMMLSECCLTYLAPTASSDILSILLTQTLDTSTPLGFALYEPINPFDAFGKVMVQNLASRGIQLLSLETFSSLEKQKSRLADAGFVDGQRSIDILDAWNAWVPESEKERIKSVEHLDEIEELELLLKHYCVAWAWRGESELWSSWSGLVRS